MDEVDAKLAGTVKHHLFVQGMPHLERQNSADFRVKCEVCSILDADDTTRGTDIVGPRFVCVHCPQRFNCCIQCAGDDDRLRIAQPMHDPTTHAFQIFFEDIGAGEDTASSAA